MKPALTNTTGTRKNIPKLARLRCFLLTIAHDFKNSHHYLATKLLLDFAAQLGGKA
jgi:hypothetical protein